MRVNSGLKLHEISYLEFDAYENLRAISMCSKCISFLTYE